MNTKPRVVISKCIEFEACRWNGAKISSPIVKKLSEVIDFIPVCAEVEIGLGVPREPIRLTTDKQENIFLVNSMTGEDHTDKMEKFSREFLAALPDVDGFLLKYGSPSCGTSNVKVYGSHGKVSVLSSKGTGLFAKAVQDLFPALAIEDESRLLNMRIREHYLTKLFAMHRLNSIEKTMKELVDFHSRNKYLFMSYNQKELKNAGKIIANHERNRPEKVYQDYYETVARIFSKMSQTKTNINVLLHLFGYFSKTELKSQEKLLFLDLLERYRNMQVPLIALTAIIQSWVARTEMAYLENQTFLQPFPKELQTIFDTGKGRMVQ
jgi:uncharacterized protein YbgA (DUF1722 family)/uncharacterized protein YbbK (DUF523 family)